MNAAADKLRSLPFKWDVVVIGGGVAGGLSALLSARAGFQTLLVEAKAFPRNKVCGCCLNATAWNILERYGLTEALLKAGAVRLNTIQLSYGGNTLCHPLKGMYAISRAVLDRTLIESAVAAGARFVSETIARVGAATAIERSIELVSQSSASRIATRVVVCADGLGNTCLGRGTEFASEAQSDSRYGVGATFVSADAVYTSGTLDMVVAADGYVGLTGVEGGKLNIAAAIERKALAQKKIPGDVIRSILSEAGRPIPEGFNTAVWQGTPALTRCSVRQAGERLFLLGDAAAYVEPFTGEGMAWGLKGAELNAEFVQVGVRCWNRRLIWKWEQTWKRYVKRRQWTCRTLSMILKSPRLTRWGMRLSRMFPLIPKALIRGICTVRR